MDPQDCLRTHGPRLVSRLLVPRGNGSLTVSSSLARRMSYSSTGLRAWGTFLNRGGSFMPWSLVRSNPVPKGTGSSWTTTLRWTVPRGNVSRVSVRSSPVPSGSDYSCMVRGSPAPLGADSSWNFVRFHEEPTLVGLLSVVARFREEPTTTGPPSAVVRFPEEPTPAGWSEWESEELQFREEPQPPELLLLPWDPEDHSWERLPRSDQPLSLWWFQSSRLHSRS